MLCSYLTYSVLISELDRADSKIRADNTVTIRYGQREPGCNDDCFLSKHCHCHPGCMGRKEARGGGGGATSCPLIETQLSGPPLWDTMSTSPSNPIHTPHLDNHRELKRGHGTAGKLIQETQQQQASKNLCLPNPDNTSVTP